MAGIFSFLRPRAEKDVRERIPNVIQNPNPPRTEMVKMLQNAVSMWKDGPQVREMVKGQAYFENRTDIADKKVYVLGRMGEKVEAKYLSNVKLAHAFMRKLTKQKIGYLLSKPFSFKVKEGSDTYVEDMQEYFDADFMRMLKNAGQEAIIKGIGWIQAYYDAFDLDEKGIPKLKFKRIPAEELRPFWEDIDHTRLQAMIRMYSEEEFDGQENKTVDYVKYYTKTGNYTFRIDDQGNWDPIGDVEYDLGIQITDQADETTREVLDGVEGIKWAKIPFIAVKYNTEEHSLLRFIKPLLDEYDNKTSQLADIIADDPNAIKVVYGYEGTDPNEFVQNLVTFRTMFVKTDGKVEVLQTKVNVEAIEAHLNRLRSDIYEFGGGVDTQNKDTGNSSGVTLKFIYSDLDMDCSDFGTELTYTLENVLWFVKNDMILRGVANDDIMDLTLDIAFNTDVTINEAETIENIKKSVGIVSNKTLLNQHPFVTDVKSEEAQLKSEAEDAMQQTEDFINQTNPTSVTEGVSNRTITEGE